MTAIPNTKRRGAIYWYRRSRRLPCGNHFRPMVSLRTACPKAARRRAAILTAKFEDLFMRLFGNPGRQFALDRGAATRIFQIEFNKAGAVGHPVGRLRALRHGRSHIRGSRHQWRPRISPARPDRSSRATGRCRSPAVRPYVRPFSGSASPCALAMSRLVNGRPTQSSGACSAPPITVTRSWVRCGDRLRGRSRTS